MSLYIFGKLISSAADGDAGNEVVQIAARSRVALAAIDEDDRIELEREPELQAPGFAFSVVSHVGDTSGTALWLEAMRQALATGRTAEELRVASGTALDDDLTVALASTRLGRFSHDLVQSDERSRGGLALVDGSIDRIFRGTRDECLREIYRHLLVPWDTGPNALYIW